MGIRRNSTAIVVIALAIGVLAPSIVHAQLFPNLPIKRKRIDCAQEDPIYGMIRQKQFGSYPTCWRRAKTVWRCPNPEAPDWEAELEERPLDTGEDDLFGDEGQGGGPGLQDPGPLQDLGDPFETPAGEDPLQLPGQERSPFELDDPFGDDLFGDQTAVDPQLPASDLSTSPASINQPIRSHANAPTFGVGTDSAGSELPEAPIMPSVTDDLTVVNPIPAIGPGPGEFVAAPAPGPRGEMMNIAGPAQVNPMVPEITIAPMVEDHPQLLPPQNQPVMFPDDPYPVRKQRNGFLSRVLFGRGLRR